MQHFRQKKHCGPAETADVVRKPSGVIEHRSQSPCQIPLDS